MFHSVIDAKYIKDYKVWIAFDNGKQGEIDLEEKIKKFGGVFIPLKKIDYFKKFKIKNDTLSWENNADIAPESLYELLKEQNKS
jgi:hypothetical protein